MRGKLDPIYDNWMTYLAFLDMLLSELDSQKTQKYWELQFSSTRMEDMSRELHHHLKDYQIYASTKSYTRDSLSQYTLFGLTRATVKTGDNLLVPYTPTLYERDSPVIPSIILRPTTSEDFQIVGGAISSCFMCIPEDQIGRCRFRGLNGLSPSNFSDYENFAVKLR